LRSHWRDCIVTLIDFVGIRSQAGNSIASTQMVQQRAPNLVKVTYQYDGLDRLARMIDAKGNTMISDRQYLYNVAGRIMQISEPSLTRTFTYDSVDRLISANYSGPVQPNENYAYDAVGNRTSSQRSAGYTYQPFNRLTNSGTAAYAYDANGNLVSKIDPAGTTEYIWDFENRLRQVSLPGSRTVSYRYDALGRRISRAAGTGVSTNFVYDGQDVMKDLNSDGSAIDYLNGPGTDNKLRLIDSRQTSAPLYFQPDHLGSTAALTNSIGAVAGRISYDAFGNSSGSPLTRYDFTGRERDSETGLMYYRARWYDPVIGRFISEDPIGLAGGINEYAYVGNDPLNRLDPTGLYEIDVHYYLTYFIASKFPCLTPHEARLIADADQSTDENPETSPGPGWTERQRAANSDFHAFNSGNNANLSNLRAGALGGETNFNALGKYLHYQQDAFSHKGFSNPFIGQAGYNGRDLPGFGGLVVDHTNHDVGKAAEMAAATWFAIRDWIRAHKCHCVDQGDTNVASWWPQVIHFLETDNDQLETKRRILGVPAR
jgi:RHS repeat-associated protein